jgi:hypothetical protein
VLDRALEIDAQGRLCWFTCVVSTSRQSGKSVLIKSIAMARAHHAQHFGEPQTVLHVSRDVASARRIMLQALRWAEDEGLKARLAQGQECITWPDDSVWAISSEKSVFGFSASAALLDEAWDIDLESTINAAIMPVLVERIQPQLWMFSTAHQDATPSMPHFRRLALEGSPRAMLAEWGAPADSDPDDPLTWRRASAYWTPQREQLMSDARHTKFFAQQWLNSWPEGASGVVGWLPSWDSLAAIPALHSDNATDWPVGACEVAVDRSCVGVAVARRRADGVVEVRSKATPTMEAALSWLSSVRGLQVVMAGASVREQVVGPFMTVMAGIKETRFASPWLAAAVLRNALAHDHDATTSAQVKLARVADTEYGLVLSQKRSAGPIPAVKAVAWCSTAAAEDWYGMSEEPQIF